MPARGYATAALVCTTKAVATARKGEAFGYVPWVRASGDCRDDMLVLVACRALCSRVRLWVAGGGEGRAEQGRRRGAHRGVRVQEPRTRKEEGVGGGSCVVCGHDGGPVYCREQQGLEGRVFGLLCRGWAASMAHCRRSMGCPKGSTCFCGAVLVQGQGHGGCECTPIGSVHTDLATRLTVTVPARDQRVEEAARRPGQAGMATKAERWVLNSCMAKVACVRMFAGVRERTPGRGLRGIALSRSWWPTVVA